MNLYRRIVAMPAALAILGPAAAVYAMGPIAALWGQSHPVLVVALAAVLVGAAVLVLVVRAINAVHEVRLTVASRRFRARVRAAGAECAREQNR